MCDVRGIGDYKRKRIMESARRHLWLIRSSVLTVAKWRTTYVFYEVEGGRHIKKQFVLLAKTSSVPKYSFGFSFSTNKMFMLCKKHR